MSNTDIFLNAAKEHCGEWVCSHHNTGTSNQPAAIFRDAKKMGYEFEEISPNRWAKNMFCPICNQTAPHYKLLKPFPVLTKQERLGIDKESRERTLKLLGGVDAFTGASITSTPEIDHKVPWTRLDKDIDLRTLSDEEIKEHFQLLTREHNLLKDRMCSICKTKLIRPPFLEIAYWYQGDEHYRGSCIGCGWYDGVEWRKCLNKHLKK